jgi:hypothetical protein
MCAVRGSHALIALLGSAAMACRQQPKAVDVSTQAAGASTRIVTPFGAAAVTPPDSGGATAVGGPGAGRPIGTRGSATPPPVKIPAARENTSAVKTDTLRGVPAVVGTDRFHHVILKPAGGGRSVILSGPQAKFVGAASGADVWLAGTTEANGDFVVEHFVVRSADGMPVLDGTLESANGQYYLVTADSVRHMVNNVPPSLREHTGERVWITGVPEKGPVTFGIIGKVP